MCRTFCFYIWESELARYQKGKKSKEDISRLGLCRLNIPMYSMFVQMGVYRFLGPRWTWISDTI